MELIGGAPLPWIAEKARARLDPIDVEWIPRPHRHAAGQRARPAGPRRPVLDDMVVEGHRPLLAAEVTVEEIFYHCAKAFLRSGLWRPEEWEPDALPSRARIVQALERTADPVQEVERFYGAGYEETIYRPNP